MRFSLFVSEFDADAQEAGQIVLHVTDGIGCDQSAEVLSGFADEGDSAGEWFSGSLEGIDGVWEVGEGFGLIEHTEWFSDDLVASIAEDIFGAFGEFEDARIETIEVCFDEGDGGCGVNDVSDAFFALAKRLFGVFPFGYVATDGLEFDAVAFLVEDHAVGPFLPAYFA